MTANTVTNPTCSRLLATGAALAAVAVGATIAAPAASAAPVNPALVLTQAQFPAGSTDYRSGQVPRAGLGVRDDAPQQCRAAGDRLNASMRSAQGVAASARNGYSFMLSSVISPVQASAWRDLQQQCGGRAPSDLPVPGDLARYNPAVITYEKGGRTGSIEGVADVGGFTVDVYVKGVSDTPASTDKFWQVFRAQIQKVQAGR